MNKINHVVGGVLLLITSVGHSQYADEESCSFVAELEVPDVHGAYASAEAATAFSDKFISLNHEYSDEILSLPDGWIFLVLADCYRGGIVVDRDRPKGTELLRVAAKQGNDNASHMVASIDVFQSGDPIRQREGFEYLDKERTHAGSAYAAGKIGWAYQQGLGVEKDLDKALELYHYAAEHGMTYWQYLLAHAYEKGYLGLEINEERSKYWLAFEPKVHLAVYACWVATYYSDGTFPANEALHAKYQRTCDETSLVVEPLG